MESSPSPVAEEDEVTQAPNRTKSASSVKKRKQIPVTVPKPFNLGLSKRVEERHQYNEEIERRRKEAEGREMMARLQQEERDKKELKDYRKSLDFKATPIRKYQDFSINPSEKELTYPLGPLLSARQHRHRRRGSEGDRSSSDTMSPLRQSSSASQSPAPPTHFNEPAPA